MKRRGTGRAEVPPRLPASRYLVPAALIAAGSVVVAARRAPSPAPRARMQPSGSDESNAGPRRAPSLAALAPAEPGSEIAALIDDMQTTTNALDGPDVRGYWYTYSDGTGRTDPGPDSHVLPEMYLDRPSREFRGEGQTKWGAGLGFDLNDAVATTAPSGAPLTAQPFDASPFEGIRFDAVSKDGPVPVLVAISDEDTDVHGGVCDPNSKDPTSACGGDYSELVTFPAKAWETRTIWFSAVKLPQWTRLQASKAHGLRRDKVYAVHFQVNLPLPVGSLPPYDIGIANVSFVRAAETAGR